MEGLLQSWGFDELVQAFSDHKIDIDDLKHLTPSLLAELIPPIGTRIKFSEKLKEYLQLLSSTAYPVEIYHESVTPNLTSDDSTSTLSNIASTSSSSSDINALAASDETNNVWTFDLLPLVKNKSFYGEEELEALSKPVETLVLKDLLLKTYQGKCILKVYEDKKILNRKCRTDLVDIIITYVMQSYNRCINNEKFELIANKISELFPNERSETYYIKPIKKHDSKYGQPVVAKGKLVDKYRNIRTKLREAGLITKKSSQSSSEESLAEHFENTDESAHSKNWLESRLEPWDDVILHWKKTISLRRTSKAEKVANFLNEWPHLKAPKGYVLINIDFDSLYPDKGLLSFEEWSKFFDKLLEYRRDSINTDGLNLLELLQEATCNDIKFLIQIHLLAYLIPPRGRVKQGKKFMKPSILETAKSIIVNASIPGDVDNIIQGKRQQSTQSCSVQPYLLTEGTHLQTVNQVFVIIDDIKYKFNNIYDAFKTCFESFFALNANYPAESEHIWLLLQLSFFKIKTKWDKTIPYIMDIIQYLD